ncbi:MAG: hypothetical protein WCF59_14880 [Desulfobaccales bacterium]
MEKEHKKSVPGIDEESKRIKFDFIKSNFFRVIHVDGVFGGVSPQRLIHMSVWNERWPIPKQVSHKLLPESKLGEEITEDRISRDAIVREVEAHLIMNLETAKQTSIWLQEKIKIIEAGLKKGQK